MFKQYTNNCETAHNANSYTNSVFYMPRKKKSVIFLRAPYKNKLARLNILNLEYTSIITTKVSTTTPFNNLSNLNKLGEFLFNTQKLKHSKTRIKVITSNKTNFTMGSFIIL